MKTLQEIYTLAANFLNGDDTYTSHDIIEEAAETLENVEDNDLHELWSALVCHINWWNGNTLREQVQEGEELIEDITGYVGEYLEK